MIREICKDEAFLAQKAEPATPDDLTTAADLLETLAYHKAGCVGMAANMIGVNKRIIAFDNEGSYLVMLNPEIVKRSGPYEAEEGWVSGYPDGTFRPDAPVSRAEAVKILNHALDRRAGERAAALPFTDVEKGHWACDEIREAAVSHIYRKSGEGETWLTYER